ncbi:hypothetical protein [Pedosphaera parvula]|uniref:Uncharacterized protein n=1 Tax=Pedosphaera parvula (strain Ellin514) TaxID=320771 RepID=B9XHS0_PEDPL|nr:hypothetical protein [Pedosphaera parvula]EEF60648.1 hypothetical protein Cflav_PD6239 [Pedosphaera parvula Ellin514]
MKFIFAIALLLGVSAQAGEIVLKKDTGFSVADLKFSLTNAQDNSLAEVTFSRTVFDVDEAPVYNFLISRFGSNYLFFNPKSLSLVADGQTIHCVNTSDLSAMRSTVGNTRKELEGFDSDEKTFLKVCQAKQVDLHLDGDKGSSIYHVDTAKADRGRAEFADLITHEASAVKSKQPAAATSSADDLKVTSVKGKLAEQSDLGWRFSYKLDASSVAGCKGKIILIQFVDEDGFALAETMEMNVTLQPGESKSITGIKTIDAKSGAKVSRVKAEVK